MKHLKIGDPAPDFSVNNQNNSTIELNTFNGKKLVIYFYPKDNTPGCTTQACNLRDNYNHFIKNGFEIIGVSADSVAKHEKFIEKYHLPFDLLADEEKIMINDYGVWGMKKFMGKEYNGIHRMTFVLDENHIITQIIEKVKTKIHSDQILNV